MRSPLIGRKRTPPVARGRPGVLVHEAFLDGVTDDLRSFRKTQLLHEPDPVRAHRLGTQRESAGNLHHGASLAEEPEHLEFTIRQALVGLSTGIGLEISGEALRQIRTHVAPPGRYVAHCADQFAGRAVFREPGGRRAGLLLPG